MKKTVAIILAMLVLLSSIVCTACVANAAGGLTLSYNFTGAEANKAGFAEGTISLTANSSSDAGTYYLYWANSTKALGGYRHIAMLNVSSGTATYKMLDHTAIPPKATQMIAIKGSTSAAPAVSSRTVANAAATWTIPSNKILSTGNAIYSFGAFSDPQLANDKYGEGKYPFDEKHWAAALETFSRRGMDFLASSGDIVNDQNGGQTYAAEYRAYQKILADSSFVNPVWECNGNHDVHVTWHSSTPVNNTPFVKGTGLDSKIETINKNKAYFEVTEPTTGDHFLFMAQEGGFDTNQGNQFSDAQLAWLEGLLKKYHGDGKNIFIFEHANVEGWGSGDKPSAPYYYDLGMKRSQAATDKFCRLMETYKECIIVTGHTHLELSAHLNYSDNNGTSAVMMHNSAIGGVRRLINGSVNRDPKEGLTEGYFVDVYNNCVIFNGANLWSDEIMPDCTYIIETSTSAIEKPIETKAPTQAPTPVPTQPAPTQSNTLYGDADLDGNVTITDATCIQLHLAKLQTLTGQKLTNAKVSGNEDLTIMDTTLIQQFLARLIDQFPAEKSKAVKDVASTGVSVEEFDALLASAKAELSSNYTYSSFDQYQALKKYVKQLEKTNEKTDTTYNKLNQYLGELSAIITATGGSSSGGNTGGNTGSTIDVYFTNTPNWSTVYAYVWSDSANNGWPGETMTYVGTDSDSKKVYKITVPAGRYNSIIFSNGTGSTNGTQTNDLTLGTSNNQGFKATNQSGGKYNCETYVYQK